MISDSYPRVSELSRTHELFRKSVMAHGMLLFQITQTAMCKR
jgi:hypothetical protein